MTHQEQCAESAMDAAARAETAGNHANAMHFVRLAAAHLEQAARMVPCKRGVPIDSEARSRISKRYREVLNLLMDDSRRLAPKEIANA